MAPDPRFSPDGQFWSGSAWVPASPDRLWWWDGQTWQPIEAPSPPLASAAAAPAVPPGKMEVKVRRYTSTYVLERDMPRWLKKGYEVQTHNTRKKVFSPLTGIFTRGQVHTVTYVRRK